MPRKPEVTAAIPLCKSYAWRANVLGNIERLAGSAKVLVSGPDGDDETLAWLSGRIDPASDVTLIGRRPGCDGLARHVNDLVERMETPLGMILPHDDEVDADWIIEARDELSRDPDAILAVGRLEGMDGPGHLFVGHVHELDDRLQNLSNAARREAAGEFMVSAQHNLGLAFRGVFRVNDACPMPEGIPGDEWSDLYWACAMATKGRFTALPSATYRKRFRPEATHLQWDPFDVCTLADGIQAHVINSLDQELRQEAAMELWRGTNKALARSRSDLMHALASTENALDLERTEMAHLRNTQQERDIQIQSNEKELEKARQGSCEADRRLAVVYRSRSWRWSAPLRAVARQARRLAGHSSARNSDRAVDQPSEPGR